MIHELNERVHVLQNLSGTVQVEAKERAEELKVRTGKLEQQLGLFTVWAEEIQRRLGLNSPSFFSSSRKAPQ